MRNVQPRSLLALLNFLLVTIFVMVSAVPAKADWIWNSNPKVRAEQYAGIQKVSQRIQVQIFDQLADAGGNDLLKLKDGTPVPLEQLKKQVRKIEYKPQLELFAASSADCFNSLDAQWITAKDSPSGKPVVSLTKSNDMQMEPKDRMLLTHETISSLGVVDDEYQVTGPLFSLAAEAKDRQTDIAEVLKEPAFQELAKPLQNIEIREHAPSYNLQFSDSCYHWNDGAGDLMNRESNGGTTAIGGGGDGSALAFKVSLLSGAHAWWSKNQSGKQASEKEKTFLRLLGALGVEPWNESVELNATDIPVQMEFAKSQRTGKLTVFFFIDRLEKIKALDRAREQVYRHVVNYMMNAKNEAQLNRHTLYGGELAWFRGISKATDFKSDLVFFLKD